jgi:hypothetical protein
MKMKEARLGLATIIDLKFLGLKNGEALKN